MRSVFVRHPNETMLRDDRVSVDVFSVRISIANDAGQRDAIVKEATLGLRQLADRVAKIEIDALKPILNFPPFGGADWFNAENPI